MLGNKRDLDTESPFDVQDSNADAQEMPAQEVNKQSSAAHEATID
jgi:hypothetical protein